VGSALGAVHEVFMVHRSAGTRAYAAILFIVLFGSNAYFYQAGGWNQNSRFALVRAITGRGTLRIDGFENCTGDRSISNGHYYSDKAPGVAFASVPFVAVGRLACRVVGVDPESYPGIAGLSYLATVFTNGLATALAAVCLFFLSRRFGATRGAAAVVALGFGLGTPMWAYASLFYGQALSAACLVFAFTAAVALTDSESPRRDRTLAAVVGGTAGWATVTEFPAAVPAVILTVFALANARRHGWSRTAGVAAALAAAALACVAVLGAYQWACFGSPFHVAYTSEEGFEAMKEGFFGLTAPTAERFRGLLIGDYRGLLPLAPILALTPIGLMLLVWKRETRGPAVVAAIIAAFYLLVNASYHYWEGGWSYGPRHLSPGLAFACLGIVPLWTAARRAGRIALASLALYGIAVTLVAVSTTPQPPADFTRPVAQLLWPSFEAGRLSLNSQRFPDLRPSVDDIVANRNAAAWNAGQLAGLKGHASLLPLALLWMAGLATWLAVDRRNRSPLPPGRAERA
jgi:hypothetical protein